MRGTLVLTAILLAVAAIRFDYWDPGPVRRLTAGAHGLPWGHGVDVEGYVRLVAYFRGSAPADSMLAPFCFRPLVPAAASLLPFPALTALDVVNLLALAGALLLLLAVMRRIGLGERSRWYGGLLFALSFPTFYYGAIGFVDPVAILAAALLLHLTLREAPLPLLAAVAILAALVKETNAAFCVLPVLYAWFGGSRSWSRLAWAASVPAAAVAAAMTARALLPFPGSGYFWTPALAPLLDNLSRPRTYLSLALTVGPPLFFAGAAWVGGRAAAAIGERDRRLLASGAAIAAGLYLYSFASAFTDGRIVWASYPFLIPLAASWFEERRAAGVRMRPSPAAAPSRG
ncbi:MAG TPA: hypothetical protein VFS09_04900 [Candidatus Eisenbacteria bacterium]|nr:hypothetical protein [Candidatus Eisenbacteria bacterium]